MSQAREFSALFKKAVEAGRAAGVGSKPAAMIVSEADVLTGVPNGRSWYVAEGACGFAWVTVRPGNCAFANWLKKNGHASKSWSGGVCIWISDYNQSVDRKEAHAYAMAKVLSEAGFKAYAGSRLD